MKYKKSIIVLVLAIFLFGVASVCASDANDTVGELSQADADEMVSVEETGLISLSQKEEISGEGNVGTFSELQNNITEKYGSTLILTKDYEHEDDFESNGIIINQSITIDGQGHKIDAQEKSRIFKITADNVILKNINFINANTTMQGGAVQFEKSGTVSDCNFTNNKATYIAAFGGAVYMDSGSVINCNFVNNYAYNEGGSVFFMNDGVMTNCNFTGNTAMYGGAAYFASSSSLSVVDCNFINNTATGEGGAIYMGSGSIKNCNFTDNTADYGGAVYSDESRGIETISSNFINNSADATGGAVYVYSEATLIDCNFIDNSADWGAAAIMDSGCLKDCNFASNSANNGSAIYFYVGGNVTDCNFTKNKATENGGAIFTVDYINIFDSLFNNNIANNSGGAVYIDGSCLNSKISSTFINNSAKNGGAIYFNDKIENVTINSVFKDNGAERNGGAIYVQKQSMNSNFSSEFYNNKAKNAIGGAIFFRNSVENNTFESIFANNYALYGGAIMFYNKANNNRFNSNFISNVAKSCGGAMFFYNTTDSNNFTGYFYNNSALGQVDETVGNGGAITFKDVSTNCQFTSDFIDNSAALNGGGVNYRQTPYNITFNGNFINNTSPRGGGVNFFESFENVIFNGEFIGNSATNGGAIAAKEGIIKDVSFEDNYAETGGAIWLSSGSVLNCNFINNNANEDGGAVYFNSSGSVLNSNFTDNSARYGGAVYFIGNGEVTSCNFADNTASCSGGAIWMSSGNVTDSNFTDNTAIRDGGAIKILSGNVTYCNFDDNTANRNGGAVFLNETGNVENCNFTANSAIENGGAVYLNNESSVIDCNFNYNAAINHGGAVDICSGTILNCNFNNNTVATMGGAVYSYAQCNIIDSNFTENKATGDDSCGGAVYLNNESSVINCNFTNNAANGNKKYGGAIAMSSGNIEKCNFNNNSAFYAGAVWFDGKGNVADCTFINNKATGTTSWGGAIRMDYGNVGNSNFTNNSATYRGGAIFFNSFKYSGYVENCSFDNNTARLKGGAIYFTSTSSPSIAINCNFTDNRASDANGNGGAILIYSGSIENCDFNSNTAPLRGGAVYFDRAGNVTNCNFAVNKATYSTGNGGAIYFYNKGNVANCNFTDNSASNRGGAVYFETACNLTDCNFEGNNASTGSAIYLFSPSASKTIGNSYFLNNKAKSEDLKVMKNENNITITFTGNDNLLNAIHSRNDAEVTFTNVTYWSANGIANTGSLPITPARSNKEAGQNITVSVVVNDEIVLSEVKLTDENGTVVLDISAGENYFIGARHDTDSYYTEAIKTVSNSTEFDVNVTSQTTNNKTVNMTAKSNIPNEIINGTLSFLVLNGTEISANYGGNGTWWAVYEFDNAGDYNVNASYIGLDNVVINDAIVSIRLDASVDVINKTLELLIDDTFTIVATTTPEGLNVTFVPDDSGVYSIGGTGKLTALKEGTGSILVKVGGDGIYAENSTTVNVTVNKIPTEITVVTDSLDLFVGDEHSIVANLTPADAGNVTFKSSNEDLVLVENDGNVIANGVGQAIITVSFAGNDKYAAAQNKTINVTVRLNDASVSVDNDTLYLNVGETYAINATKHPDTILLNINYTSSNSSVATVDENGVVTAVGKGTAIITLSVGDDEIYAENSTTVNVTVNDVGVMVSDLVKYYSNPEKLIVNLTKNGQALSNASVMITINGVTYTIVTDGDGIASLAINLNEGNYSACVEVPDYEISKTVDVIVKSTIYAKDIVKVFRNATQYDALFIDGNGNTLANTTVSFNINGIFYNRTTNASGWARLNINLGKGTFIITASNPVTGEMKSNNITVISKLQTDDLTKYFRNDTQFVVRAVADDGSYAGAGETVTFNINGVFYNRTTNETGHAKLNINLGPGDYIITSYYDGCAEGNNIHVIPTLTANDLNMTYDDKSQFTANLVDGQGNPYAKQNITFNINGVFYNRTTDVNGDAKLNINLQAGEYIITSSYGYAVIANKITITS